MQFLNDFALFCLHGKDGINLFVGAGTQRGPCAKRFSLDSRGGAFLSLLVFSPRTALIALLAAAVSLGFLLLISRYSAQNAPVEAQANRDMTGAILEYARGLAVVKSFGRDILLEHFDIDFDHVSFGYDDRQVLHDVSFTIPAGKSFGILGGTGSGKSSLLLLLCRLYAPSEGRVTVGGADLADLPAAWVRDHVGVVLQEPFLFSRTIEENIGICGADRETVRKAAATACIASDIEQFANGYDTMVGERGVTLSGGQKQRVAIARMLTKKTPVMVFDDSLSAVDTQTDEHIREALNRDLTGTTSIIISHRITTLMDCDNILVLEYGKVLQRGTPQQLLQQPGLFRQIYDMQMSIGEEEPA